MSDVQGSAALIEALTKAHGEFTDPSGEVWYSVVIGAVMVLKQNPTHLGDLIRDNKIPAVHDGRGRPRIWVSKTALEKYMADRAAQPRGGGRRAGVEGGGGATNMPAPIKHLKYCIAVLNGTTAEDLDQQSKADVVEFLDAKLKPMIAEWVEKVAAKKAAKPAGTAVSTGNAEVDAAFQAALESNS